MLASRHIQRRHGLLSEHRPERGTVLQYFLVELIYRTLNGSQYLLYTRALRRLRLDGRP